MKIVLSTIFFLFLCHSTFAQPDKRAARLALLGESYAQIYGFSGNIKVVVRDQEVFEGSYGLADRSFGIKNDAETRFSINSISKTFTATAILILAQEGKLDLQAPVGDLLPELTVSWKDSVRVHHLLSHTSGLPRESGVQAHDEMTFAEQVALVEKQDLLFSPGDRYGYSNAGVILLGAILERVSGQPYAEFMAQEILLPLGLENTGYYQGRSVVKKQAVPYRLSAAGLESAQRSKHYGDNAGGGLYATVSDLYQYVKGIEDHKVLSPAYTKLLFAAHAQSGETDFEGYGWSIKYFGDEKMHFAAGSGYGTKSVIIRAPESGDFIGITSNWGNTPILQLLRDLYLTIKGEEVTLPSRNALANPAAFKEQIGTYRFNPGELKKHLGMEGERMQLQVFEGKLFLDDELMAAAGESLKLTYTSELKIDFEGPNMIIRINGNEIKGEKL